MSRQLPPSPSLAPNLLAWARQVHQYLMEAQQGRRETQAQPVFLMHHMGGEKATTDGIMMYDPAIQKVVVSVNGQWKALEWTP